MLRYNVRNFINHQNFFAVQHNMKLLINKNKHQKHAQV